MGELHFASSPIFAWLMALCRTIFRSGCLLVRRGALSVHGSRCFGDRGKAQPGAHQTPIVHDLWERRELGAHSESDTATPIPRPPSFSRLSVAYPFTTDELLRDR